MSDSPSCFLMLRLDCRLLWGGGACHPHAWCASVWTHFSIKTSSPSCLTQRAGGDGLLSFSLTDHASASDRRRGGATQKELQHPWCCITQKAFPLLHPPQRALVFRPVPFWIYLADSGEKVHNFFVICGLLSFLNMNYCVEQFIQLIISLLFPFWSFHPLSNAYLVQNILLCFTYEVQEKVI